MLHIWIVRTARKRLTGIINNEHYVNDLPFEFITFFKSFKLETSELIIKIERFREIFAREVYLS